MFLGADCLDRWHRRILFMKKIRIDENGCWRWTGAKVPAGYGVFRYEGGNFSHRFSFEQVKGHPPEGMEVDHMCRVRDCANPDHLRALTHRDNMLCGDTVVARNAARTECVNGHPLDEQNTYIRKEGWRVCRRCRADRGAARRSRVAGRTYSG